MPKRTDIESILVIGSGPIIIGQGTEFDYSGVQACKVLREEGYRVILANSNPATIMTDKNTADSVHIEPLTPEFIKQIIQEEHPDALLPTLGGQTALNLAVSLARDGFLEEQGVELIGCSLEAIERGENRQMFGECMQRLGLEIARGEYATTLDEALLLAENIGYPVVVRPSFTLGGAGGGIAHSAQELTRIASNGLDLSPITEILIEESIEGWKEYETEVMRDAADNGIIVCSIENLDPMGVHTGDSITVAPAQTLSDPEYQLMRNASLAILREIGVETGGSNVQFAINPETGRMIVIEMNPRVSRSSALASKATGFPIAKAAARMAVGFTLDEILNDITGSTRACFEPALDYCVVKMPRFAFEKFHGSSESLTTRMKAVGEVMAIGRTFEEALGKAVRSMEDGRAGLGADGKGDEDALTDDELRKQIMMPTPKRIFCLAATLRRGWSVGALNELSRIDPWFLHGIKHIVDEQNRLAGKSLGCLDTDELKRAKSLGLSDAQIAFLCASTEQEVRARRKALGIVPVFKTVDTCAAEFPAVTSYFYKTYDNAENETTPANRKRIIILGAGPNRIGQGIEFDYCCVQAAYALHDAGFETVMVNCNPETVSTDYDTSDVLFFEPLTLEDVMDIIEDQKPDGVIVTLGGQTPLNLASALYDAKVPLLGTPYHAIEQAENRDDFAAMMDELGFSRPAAATAQSLQEAQEAARRIGYPVIIRPSFVLGGAGMGIAFQESQLRDYMEKATQASPSHPVYLDRFLEDAIELDVDCLCDGHDVYIGGIMEHIERAGDSASCIPPFSLSLSLQEHVRDITRTIALRLGVVGLMNVHFAIKDQQIYVIEANPRASRTVPFISKASDISLAKAAALIMTGRSLKSLELPPEGTTQSNFCVKEAVLPFDRFPDTDAILGPEMKSTGEVMGIAPSFPEAFLKAQIAAGGTIPRNGTAFISVCDNDKRSIGQIAVELSRLGFHLAATEGTARVLQSLGLSCVTVSRVQDAPDNRLSSLASMISSRQITLIINTPSGEGSHSDGRILRKAAVQQGITYVTTLAAAQALVIGMSMIRRERD